MDMKKINKDEYFMLYSISRGRDNFESLEGFFEKSKILRIIKKLDKIKLIKLCYREGEIYGFMETKEGDELINNKIYENWFIECGD